jgi:nicotinamide mononucleotide (NMN) deamidase PncC
MRKSIVQTLHDSHWLGVVAVTGGGSGLISTLLGVPGASSTVLEARVPYAPAALAEFLGGAPDQACSAITGRGMAMAAFERARKLTDADPARLFGLAMTASLASTTAKKGPHRLHVAVQTAGSTYSWHADLAKGQRNRAEEETVAENLGLYALDQALDLKLAVTPPLHSGEVLDEAHLTAPAPWQHLLLGDVQAIHARKEKAPPPSVLFPGAFNPLHDGHRAMADYASSRFGSAPAFEICINNVDKPALNYLDLQHRLAQFDTDVSIWLTRTATFIDKARLFPGAVFLVGADTLVRIADPRYYDSSAVQRDKHLSELAELGNRLLVFGRNLDGAFTRLEDLDLPRSLTQLCDAVPEEAFRHDVSSTELRHTGLPRA